LSGALILIISYSENYRGTERGETTRAVGTLVTSFGTAISFLANAIHLSGDNYKILLWAAAAVCLLTVALLGVPRLIGVMGGDEKRQKGQGGKRAEGADDGIGGSPIDPTVMQDGVPVQAEEEADQEGVQGDIT
jgi:hypothetical protein